MASFEVKVDRRKCKGCEECLEVCTACVFEMRDGRSLALHGQKCVGCRSCIQACREDAIMVSELQPRLSETCLALLKDMP
jgi:NAD-dependent dihydropyrimidine dehydrogenase PreA subunit